MPKFKITIGKVNAYTTEMIVDDADAEEAQLFALETVFDEDREWKYVETTDLFAVDCEELPTT